MNRARRDQIRPRAGEDVAMNMAGTSSLIPFRRGQFDNLDLPYIILDAIHLALAKSGGLSKRDAERAFRLAVKHLGDRRTGLDTFSSPVTMRRACGLARLMARSVSNLDRQVRIEQPPTNLNISIENLFAWIEESLDESLPVVVLLDGAARRLIVVQGVDDERLYLFGGDGRQFIERSDCALRRGLVVLSATNMFRVRVTQLEPIIVAAKRPTALGYCINVHG